MSGWALDHGVGVQGRDDGCGGAGTGRAGCFQFRLSKDGGVRGLGRERPEWGQGRGRGGVGCYMLGVSG